MAATDGAARPSARPTMADVARLARVSPTTVSFVINGRTDGAVGEETVRRVLDAVDRLGYRPNRAAQTLRTRRTRTIGFITDEIAVRPPAGLTIAGAHDAARLHGSLLLIAHATREPDVVHDAMRDLHDRQVDAMVYAVVGTVGVELPPVPPQTPMVVVNGFAERVPHIVPDEYAGGRSAAQALLDAGHRRLGYVTGGLGAWATVERLRGFHDALRAARVPPRSAVVVHGDFEADTGYELTRRLLLRRRPPTGVCYGNDVMAIGGYFAIKEAGLDIPGDISVVGYDDHDRLADRLSPPLSTIRLPYYEMGRWAAEQILEERLDTVDRLTYASCLPIPRASIAPPVERRR